MERIRLSRRTVCWFSCGAASAVATKLTLLNDKTKNVSVVYCDTGSEHEDNKRFLHQCEEWFGKEVTILKSTEYEDTWDVWEQRKYLSGVHGAPCTGELKVVPRLAYQRPDDIHVFGYTYDVRDIARAQRLRKSFFELTIQTPLIQKRINKEACLAVIEDNRIPLPVMYALGYPNNNCIPCVKSESPAYWSLVRKTHPKEFKRMSRLSRKLKVKLAVYKGDRIYIDEIPKSVSAQKPVAPRCDFMCGALDLKD